VLPGVARRRRAAPAACFRAWSPGGRRGRPAECIWSSRSTPPGADPHGQHALIPLSFPPRFETVSSVRRHVAVHYADSHVDNVGVIPRRIDSWATVDLGQKCQWTFASFEVVLRDLAVPRSASAAPFQGLPGSRSAGDRPDTTVHTRPAARGVQTKGAGPAGV